MGILSVWTEVKSQSGFWMLSVSKRAAISFSKQAIIFWRYCLDIEDQEQFVWSLDGLTLERVLFHPFDVF